MQAGCNTFFQPDGVGVLTRWLAVMALGFGVAAGSRGQNPDVSPGNPIAGAWHQMLPAQVGGTIHNFMLFTPEGSFFSSSINEGGPQSGLRNELWGRYTVKPANDGLYLVTMYYEGKAPMQMCMPGFGCRPAGGGVPQRPDQGLFQFRGDTFQSNNGFTAQRSGILPVLLQKLPATWVLQPPPPLTIPAGSSGYISPKNKIPGLGGNCDDLQQSRICTYGSGGVYHTDNSTGCKVCTQP